ncbi:VCBS repeat-containing protein [bacterium]|nr:VCBS repeat-containing protein [bacterium]
MRACGAKRSGETLRILTFLCLIAPLLPAPLLAAGAQLKVYGYVRDSGQQGIAGARVEVYADRYDSTYTKWTTTEANGYYSVYVDKTSSPRVLKVRARYDNVERGAYSDSVSPSDTHAYVSVSLPIEVAGAGDLTIGGRVTEEGTGAPIGNVKVALKYYLGGWNPLKTVSTNASGAYDFGLQKDRTYMIVASKNGYKTELVWPEVSPNTSNIVDISMEADVPPPPPDETEYFSLSLDRWDGDNVELERNTVDWWSFSVPTYGLLVVKLDSDDGPLSISVHSSKWSPEKCRLDFEAPNWDSEFSCNVSEADYADTSRYYLRVTDMKSGLSEYRIHISLQPAQVTNDLAPSKLELTREVFPAGDPIGFQYRVDNKGMENEGELDIHVYASDNSNTAIAGDNFLGSFRLTNGVPANGSVSESRDVSSSGLPEGIDKYLKLKIDANSEWSGDLEDNNIVVSSTTFQMDSLLPPEEERIVGQLKLQGRFSDIATAPSYEFVQDGSIHGYLVMPAGTEVVTGTEKISIDPADAANLLLQPNGLPGFDEDAWDILDLDDLLTIDAGSGTVDQFADLSETVFVLYPTLILDLTSLEILAHDDPGHAGMIHAGVQVAFPLSKRAALEASSELNKAISGQSDLFDPRLGHWTYLELESYFNGDGFEGTFAVDNNLPEIPNLLEMRSLYGGLSTFDDQKVHFGGSAKFPKLHGVTITADVFLIHYTTLDGVKISGEVEHPIPVLPTSIPGVYVVAFKGLGLGVQGLASNPDNIAVSGDIGMTIGFIQAPIGHTNILEAKYPDTGGTIWLGTGNFELHGALRLFYSEVSFGGETEVLFEGFDLFKAAIQYDNTCRVLDGQSELNLLDIYIAEGKLHYDTKANSFKMTSEGRLVAPDDWWLVGGEVLGYTYGEVVQNPEEGYIFCRANFGGIHVHCRFNSDGTLEPPGIELEMPVSLWRDLRGTDGSFSSRRAGPLNETVHIASDTPYAVIRFVYSSGNAGVTLTDPDGMVTDSSDVFAPDHMGPVVYHEDNTAPWRIDSPGTDKREVAFLISPPEGWDAVKEGDYTLSVAEVSGLGDYDVQLLVPNVAPSLEIIEPQSDLSNPAQVNITFSADDPDDNADIRLFYDDDSEGYDGQEITRDYLTTGTLTVGLGTNPIKEDSSSGSYTWNIVDVASGTYYIYGMINDGRNMPVYSNYSSASISITHPSAPSPPADFAATARESAIACAWTASDTVPTTSVQYVLMYDTLPIGSTERFQNQINAEDLTEWEISNLTNGRTYRVAVCAMDVETLARSLPTDPVEVRLHSTTGNNAPRIVSVPLERGRVGLPYEYIVQAVDDDGDALNYELTESPPGVFIDAGTGRIAFTPVDGHLGANRVGILVTDGNGGSDVQTFYLLVDNWMARNGAPLFDTAADTTAVINEEYVYDADATDPDEDAVLFALGRAPAGMALDRAEGRLQWLVTESDVGDYPVDLVAYDGRGGVTTQTFTLEVDYPALVADFSIAPDAAEPSPTERRFRALPNSEYVTNYEWDFGDGVTISGPDKPTVSHTFRDYSTGDFPNNKTFNVTLTLTGPSRTGTQQDSVTEPVTVEPPRPVAGFTADVVVGQSPLTVQFTDASQWTTTVVYDFGDGSTTTTLANPQHTFSTTDQFGESFNVTQTAIGPSGSTTVTRRITLQPPEGALETITWPRSNGTWPGWHKATASEIEEPVASDFTMAAGASGLSLSTATAGKAIALSKTFDLYDGAWDLTYQVPMVSEHDWTLLAPSASPAVRQGTAMCYDSARGEVVLFGGWDDSQIFDDTWIFKNGEWTQKFPATSPSPRAAHAMAFDSSRGVVVLYGGATEKGSNTPSFETWEWNGSNWTMRSLADHPNAAHSGAMVYDQLRSECVFFGGIEKVGATEYRRNETWVYDGVDWIQKTGLATSPPVLKGTSIAYDTSRGVTVLFGGNEADLQDVDQTWEWNGSDWSQSTPTVSPSKRTGSGLAFSATFGGVVLFGGYQSIDWGVGNSFDDTWLWDGADWQQLSLNLSPDARVNLSLCPDSDGNLILFGGSSPETSTIFGDTWSLGVLGASSTKRGMARASTSLTDWLVLEVENAAWSNPALAVDENSGAVYILSYKEPEANQLRLRKWDGSLSEPVDSPIIAAGARMIDWNPVDGKLDVACAEGLAKVSMAGWETFNSFGVGLSEYNLSLDTDAQGYRHISYRNSGLYYWTDRPDLSAAVGLVDGTDTPGRYSTIRFDGSAPQIAYTKWSTVGTYFATWNGSSWDASWPLPAVNSASHRHAGLALDSEGDPHIVYHDSTRVVEGYLHKTSSGWESSDIYPAEGRYSNIEIAPDGTPYAAVRNKLYRRVGPAAPYTWEEIDFGATATMTWAWANRQYYRISPSGRHYIAFTDGDGIKLAVSGIAPANHTSYVAFAPDDYMRLNVDGSEATVDRISSGSGSNRASVTLSNDSITSLTLRHSGGEEFKLMQDGVELANWTDSFSTGSITAGLGNMPSLQVRDTATVNGGDCIYFAGQSTSDDTIAYGSDRVGDHIPSFISVTAGEPLEITATGTVDNNVGQTSDPDGLWDVQSNAAYELYGISAITAPTGSLVGLFDNQTEPFFIGSSGTLVVPDGATRLYLGNHDGSNWSDNSGSFSVTVSDYSSGDSANFFSAALTVPNHSPTLAPLPDVTVLAGSSDASLDLDDYADDDHTEDSELAFWTSQGSMVSARVDSSHRLVASAPLGFEGTETLSVEVSDGGGMKDTGTVVVNVVPPPETLFTDITGDSGVTSADAPSTCVILTDVTDNGAVDLMLLPAGLRPHLMEGDGNLMFADVSPGVVAASGTQHAAMIDVENSGDPLLFLLYPNLVRAYRRGASGQFDVVTTATIPCSNANQMAWADTDTDGDLDLYIAGDGADAFLRNMLTESGVVSFVDDTSTAGLGLTDATEMARFADFDRDGDADLYLAVRDAANALYANDGAGHFTLLGATGTEDPRDSYGVAVADFDNDGWPDIFAANDGRDSLFINRGDGTFNDSTSAMLPATIAASRGVVAFDYDHDGFVDAFVSIDGTENILLHNDAGLGFSDSTDAGGVDGTLNGPGTAAAVADLDEDGDLDLVQAQATLPAATLFRNNLIVPQDDPHGIDGCNWLQVDLAGTLSNAEGIGARVELWQADALLQSRDVSAGIGWRSQQSPTIHFGLGEEQYLDELRVTWPSGVVTRRHGIAPNQRIEIVEENTIDTIVISPDLAILFPGETFSFATVAHYADGTTESLESEALYWEAALPSVAAFDAVGTMYALREGETQVSANHQGIASNSATVIVASLVAQQIDITPAAPDRIAAGEQKLFMATATYTDGSSGDVSWLCEWSTSDEEVARMLPGGRAVAAQPGSVAVRATYQGVFDEVSLNILNAADVSLLAEPTWQELDITINPVTGQVEAYRHYADATPDENVTANVQWTLSDPFVASIAADGTVTALAAGTTTASASLGTLQSEGIEITVIDNGGELSTIIDWREYDRD